MSRHFGMLDYQPLFGKGARAPHERAAKIESTILVPHIRDLTAQTRGQDMWSMTGIQALRFIKQLTFL